MQCGSTEQMRCGKACGFRTNMSLHVQGQSTGRKTLERNHAEHNGTKGKRHTASATLSGPQVTFAESPDSVYLDSWADGTHRIAMPWEDQTTLRRRELLPRMLCCTTGKTVLAMIHASTWHAASMRKAVVDTLVPLRKLTNAVSTNVIA